MGLKASLKKRPVIYEIVPPRQDTSRYNTELQGVEDVLGEPRIAAINIPELINRKQSGGRAVYSPATIPPEEYALMISDRKEGIVNIVAPRLTRREFLARVRRAIRVDSIPNLVIVGKERSGDVLPGPGALEAMRLVSRERVKGLSLGGICIFDRVTSEGRKGSLTEDRRVALKAQAGCDFVTSQITFDSKTALEFLESYQRACVEDGAEPLTVFVSLTTVPSLNILALLKKLDVVIPGDVEKRLTRADSMGRESLKVATEVFREVVEGSEKLKLDVPLGLQIEQVGVNSDELSLELLDRTFPILKAA